MFRFLTIFMKNRKINFYEKIIPKKQNYDVQHTISLNIFVLMSYSFKSSLIRVNETHIKKWQSNFYAALFKAVLTCIISTFEMK